MRHTPNWKDLELDKQCGSCKHYRPHIKNRKHTARGKCELKSVYKQRTESCMKFEEAV